MAKALANQIGDVVDRRRAGHALIALGLVGIAGGAVAAATDESAPRIEAREATPGATVATPPTLLTPDLVKAGQQSLLANPNVIKAFGQSFEIIGADPMTEGADKLVGIAFTVTTESEVSLPAGIPTYAAQPDTGTAKLTVTSEPFPPASRFVVQVGLDDQVIAFLVVPKELTHEG
jgi:hypothetical protein